jgi:exopolysaccharide biosynthesis polyprenyl glycosylphosphotransferase
MLVLPVDAALLLLPIAWSPEQAKSVSAMTVIAIALLTGGNRYRARLSLSVLDEVPSLFSKVLIAAALVGLTIAVRHDPASLTTFLTNVTISLGLLVAGRVVTTTIISQARRREVVRHSVVVVGGGPLSLALVQELRNNPRYGLQVEGYVDDGEDRAKPPDEVFDPLVPRLGRLADLDRVVLSTHADVILVSEGGFADADLHEAVRTQACTRCDLLVVPRMRHFRTQSWHADHIGSIPVMRILNPSLRGPARAVKRGFDVLVAATTLVAVSPVLALCALAVRAEGGPGVIFRQQRVGKDGRVFDCLKFRSMRPADEGESATQWSIATDHRVGRVGRFLRRTSLDELPQLWNILRGDMTLVGPRPERPHFVTRFSEEYERYAQRHRVRSGLTGLAQVSGLRGDTSIATRALYDNYYIENWSLWLDIKIILRTFGEVLFAKGR